jgi:hypothetical protein
VILGHEEEQRGRRHVEIALHVAEIEAGALIREAARLVEPSLRGHQHVRKPVLAIADRVAVDFDDVAEPEPAVDRICVHEREVGREGSRLRRAGGRFSVLLVPLSADDDGRSIAVPIDVRAGAPHDVFDRDRTGRTGP